MFTFVLPGFKLVVTFVPGKPFSIMRLIYLSLFICNDQREGDSLIGYGLNAHKRNSAVKRGIVEGGGWLGGGGVMKGEFTILAPT